MKIQHSTFKVNGIKAVCIVLSFFLFVANASGTPVLSIVPIERPLTIYSIPIQSAKANSNFTLNLAPYINKIQTEIDYKVTNNSTKPHPDLNVVDLPAGLVRVYEGAGVCPAKFSLNYNQSCILRFYVNKAKYTHSIGGAPIVCASSRCFCYKPSQGKQIDDLVAALPGPTKIKITPAISDGLGYNPNTLTISGKPTKASEFKYSITATNGVATTAARPLQIKVAVNEADKPVFKVNNNIVSAMPDQDYKVNLIDLIEPRKGFMVTNQVTFRIDTTHSHPAWLSIDPQNTTILQGHVPPQEAGKTQDITLFATSNTGGDSSTKTIRIPVAYDPTKKPIIDKNIKLTSSAGEAIRNDFRYNITDPAADGNITLRIEKIEPKATWLHISSANPTELYGLVPDEDVGINYTLTLSATTPTGGKSDNVDIPLNIAINEDMTPRFHAASPNLPIFYKGHSYVYDFVSNRDVYPDFNSTPYTIELAKDKNNPKWVRIESNKLIIDEVPNVRPQQQVYVTVKNIPGGVSEVITLDLFVQ